jgi:hypothetical protein
MTQRRNFNDTTTSAPPLSVPGSPFTAAAAAGGGPGAAGLNGVGGNRSDLSKGVSSSHDYYSRQGGSADEQDFEQGLSAQERQMLELENENIVRKLETELNQVRYDPLLFSPSSLSCWPFFSFLPKSQHCV